MATSKIKSMAGFESGKWTPHIYDSNTKVTELPKQDWYRIGPLYVMLISTEMPDVNIETMLQIRNIPCSRVIGGSVYYARTPSCFGDRTIQASSIGVYFRPNITGNFDGGAFTALLVGV